MIIIVIIQDSRAQTGLRSASAAAKRVPLTRSAVPSDIREISEQAMVVSLISEAQRCQNKHRSLENHSAQHADLPAGYQRLLLLNQLRVGDALLFQEKYAVAALYLLQGRGLEDDALIVGEA